MPSKISHQYRVPILLSLTLAIVLIALKVERNTLNISFIVLGSIFGTFVLDLDYIIHAYFVDPEAQFSKMTVGYLKHKDFGNFLRYVHTHKHELKEKTLNSALFQIVLAGATMFVLSSTVSLLLKTLVLSAYVNSIYRFLEFHLHGHTADWFWSFKMDLKKNSVYSYILILLAALLYALYLF